MPSKILRDEALGKTRVRLVRRDDGTLQGGYWRPDRDMVKFTANPDETQHELWERLVAAALGTDRSFVGFDGAKARFIGIFPKGFQDPEYLRHERNYKVAARDRLNAAVPVEEAAHGTGFAEEIIAAYRATNLLHPIWERPRVEEVLASPDADAFIQQSARFALGDRSCLGSIARIGSGNDAAKWPIVTYLPFLWDTPLDHVILRHKPAAAFAECVGHAFPYLYNSELLPEVYDSLLDLFTRTSAEIADLEPRDWIDLQSFVWVVSEYEQPQSAPSGERDHRQGTIDTPTLPPGVVYFDDDDAYFAWLADNPDGYVVNVRPTLTDGYVQLHRAMCKSISARREPGAYTERGYRKLCARTRRDISRAPIVCGRPEGSFTAECSLCQP